MLLNNETIRSSDISVIIQGPVYKETEYSSNCTKEVINRMRELLPGAEIILSTWEGADIEGLDVDKVVRSIDPGYWETDYGVPMDNGSSINTMNINRQIVSSVEGLKLATRKYAIKTRTDIVLTKTDFLDEFNKYNNPVNEMYKDVLKHRVIALSATNPRLEVPQPFYICDFFFFGYTEDVLNVWSIPLIDKNKQKKMPGSNVISYFENYGAEQYLWLGFLRKHQEVKCEKCQDISDNAIERSEASFASYAILIPAYELGVYSLKIGRGGYMAKPSNVGQYTYNQWKVLYNRYCGGNIEIKGGRIENIIYMLQYQGKRLLRTEFKSLFLVVKNIYNKANR